MRLALLILTLWLLLDVVLVAALVGARRTYRSWARIRAQRAAARFVRPSL